MPSPEYLLPPQTSFLLMFIFVCPLSFISFSIMFSNDNTSYVCIPTTFILSSRESLLFSYVLLLSEKYKIKSSNYFFLSLHVCVCVNAHLRTHKVYIRTY